MDDGSQEGKVESRQKIWRAGDKTKAHWRCDKVIRWLSYKYLGGKVTGLRVTWWQGDTIWFTGTVTRWQYEKVIRRHCDPIEYYWQRGVEFLFKFTVYLRIKLHSFINDLHMYNKRYILISWREEIRARNFVYIFCSLFLFLIEFLVLFSFLFSFLLSFWQPIF